MILNQLLFLHHDSNLKLIEKGKAEPRHKLPTLYQVLNGTYRRKNGERSLTMKNTQFEAINQRHIGLALAVVHSFTLYLLDYD